MFVDDLLGMVFHVGHLTCNAGYIGDENALFSTRALMCAPESAEPFPFEERETGGHAVGLLPLLADRKVASARSYCSFIDCVIRKLNCQPKELPLMLTSQDSEAGLGADRSALAAVLFEELGVPALHFVSKSLAALFSTGRISGLLVDAGAHHVDCAAIHEGHLLRRSLRSVAWGGESVTAAVRRDAEQQFAGRRVPGTLLEISSTGRSALSLRTVDKSLRDLQLMDHYRQLKEEMCVLGTTEGTGEDEHWVLKLPDEQTLYGHEAAKSMRTLFAPMSGNLPSQLVGLIERSHIDTQKALPGNTVLVGGSSLTPGLARDLERGLSEASPAYMKLKVTAAPRALERKGASWIGASILASVGDFQRFWVSKFDYQEAGDAALARKCLN